MLVKCTEEGCALSAWADSGKCAFHYRPGHWDDPVYKQNLLAYINDRAENPDGNIGLDARELLVENVEMTALQIISLWGKITRPITFRNCRFETNLFFHNAIYRYTVRFDRCSVLGHDESSLLNIVGCTFDDFCLIETECRDIVFVACTFGKSITLTFSKAWAIEPTPYKSDCIFQDCRFQNVDAVFRIFVNNDLQLLRCISNSMLQIDNGEEGGHNLKIDDTIINDHCTIVASHEKELCIVNVKISKDVLIKGATPTKLGNYRRLRIPNLTLSRLDRFGQAIVSFRDVNLSEYQTEQSDFLFHNVDLDNVEFSKRSGIFGDRFGFNTEESLKSKLKELRKQPLKGPQKFKDLEECYKNLKTYYDSRGDYLNGSRFYASQLWAQWLTRRIKSENRLTASFQFFSWYGWFNLASRFNQSILLPLIWLVVITVAFTQIYYHIGVWLEEEEYTYIRDGNDRWNTMSKGKDFSGDRPISYPPDSLRWERAKDFAFHNLILKINNVSEVYYPSSRTWRKESVSNLSFIAIWTLQLVLTAPLLSLFIIALRRRFKR